MAIILDSATDGPLKRNIVEMAFGEIGMAGYEFGRSPEEVNDALFRLNALMREWPFNSLSYEQPAYGVGRGEDASGLLPENLTVVALSLAKRIAPTMGATLSPESRAELARLMSILHSQLASIPTMPLAGQTVRGSGYRGAANPYINETVEIGGDFDPGDLARIVGQ